MRHREETNKRTIQIGKTHFREQRPKTFKEETDKERNTHSSCSSKMPVSGISVFL